MKSKAPSVPVSLKTNGLSNRFAFPIVPSHANSSWWLTLASSATLKWASTWGWDLSIVETVHWWRGCTEESSTFVSIQPKHTASSVLATQLSTVYKRRLPYLTHPWHRKRVVPVCPVHNEHSNELCLCASRQCHYLHFALFSKQLAEAAAWLWPK